MPKRTNEFQELVTLIQEAVAPKGAKVTASAMVPSPSSGQLREIDVLVEHPGGRQALKVAVEAKDEKRKFDATKIEAIIGKYFGPGALPVGKVVVVTHRGFTKGARARANDVGITLFTLAEARAAKWNAFFPTGMVRQGFVVDGGLFAVDLIPTPPLPPGVDKARFFTQGRLVMPCCGRDIGSPLQQMTVVLNSRFAPWSREFRSVRLAAMRTGGEIEFPLEFRPEARHLIRFEGTDYEIEKVIATMRCVYMADTLAVKSHTMSGEDGETNVVHSVGIEGPLGIQMVMPMGAKNARGIIKHRADFSRLIGPPWLHSLAVRAPTPTVPGQAIYPTEEFDVRAPAPAFIQDCEVSILEPSLSCSDLGDYAATNGRRTGTDGARG